MRHTLKALGTACLLALLQFGAGAQESDVNGIPASVYYLMPSFDKGVVYFSGQAPASGLMNICAVDNTLRFLDKNGQEIVADNISSVIKVLINDVWFIRSGGMFYRAYPVTKDFGVAIRRDVNILKEARKGVSSATIAKPSVMMEHSSAYTGGNIDGIDKSGNFPYVVSEAVLIYNNDKVLPIIKKNLKTLFPDKKDEIDAYFKARKPLPRTLDEALEFLSQWE